MGRLYSWDYTKPFYYLVTIKRLKGLKPLAYLSWSAPWYHQGNIITAALYKAIKRVLKRFPGIESIVPFVIMPDHLHLLVKIADGEVRVRLDDFVEALIKEMTAAYCSVDRRHVGPVFDPEWHDWICKREYQLSNFSHYIRDNPKNALERMDHPDMFEHLCGRRNWRMGKYVFDCVGNFELLDVPALMAIRASRKTRPGTPEWNRLMDLCDRWRPGMTAVGTWFSPAEREARRRILKKGGNIIVLRPLGFGTRWHPPGTLTQTYCADGRILYVSVYKPTTSALPKGETRRRCLEMNDLAKAMQNRIYDRETAATQTSASLQHRGIGR